jgi:hypothetical protein
VQTLYFSEQVQHTVGVSVVLCVACLLHFEHAQFVIACPAKVLRLFEHSAQYIDPPLLTQVADIQSPRTPPN